MFAIPGRLPPVSSLCEIYFNHVNTFPEDHSGVRRLAGFHLHSLRLARLQISKQMLSGPHCEYYSARKRAPIRFYLFAEISCIIEA